MTRRGTRWSCWERCDAFQIDETWVAEHVLDEDRRLAEFIRSQASAALG